MTVTLAESENFFFMPGQIKLRQFAIPIPPQTQTTIDVAKQWQRSHQNMFQSHPFRSAQMTILTDNNDWTNAQDAKVGCTKCTHNTSTPSNTPVSQKQKWPQWLRNCNTMKNPKQFDKQMLAQTINPTDEESSTFASDHPVLPTDSKKRLMFCFPCIFLSFASFCTWLSNEMSAFILSIIFVLHAKQQRVPDL